MSRRPGLSLIEMLIAIAILSILIGLLLGAVQKVRMSGSKLTLSNKTRQIALSVHNIISTDNRLPAQCEWDKSINLPLRVLAMLSVDHTQLHDLSIIPEFTNGDDPSYQFYPTRLPDSRSPGNASFGFNYLVFGGLTSTGGVSDGLSNTMMLSERYARCGKFANVNWSLILSIGLDKNRQMYPQTLYTNRTMTFSDNHYDDILPVYIPARRASLGSIPGLTFQATPKPDACDPRVLQSSTPNGLVVALMDGSVRTISPAIDPAVYWSSMTPDKGEVVNLD